jgi:hypothetical protein
MSIYDIDPGLIAALDQRMGAVGADLDACIQSYRVHRGQTDNAVAFVVLTENMISVLTLEEACEVLAFAVQRLAEADATSVPEPGPVDGTAP